MASPTLRNVKGSELTIVEVDDNFTNINNELADSLSYDSATSTVIMGRIGVGSLVANLSPITDLLPTALSFNSTTNVLTVNRDGVDINANLSPLVEQVDTTVTATGLTMEVGKFYNVSAASQTMTLPANAVSGNKLELSVRNFDDTSVARNGNSIMGIDSDMTVDIAYSSVEFVFLDSSYGWFVKL